LILTCLCLFCPIYCNLSNYLLVGDKVIRETDGTNTIYYHYDLDGSLIGLTYNNFDFIYIKNLEGDIIAITDTTGISLVKYTYDAYGNYEVVASSSYEYLAEANPYAYRSYRYDQEIGLYYLNSRYYDPVIGRFISSDGLLGQTGNFQSHNMYAYCANNPIMMVDPSGFDAVVIVTFDSDHGGPRYFKEVGHIMLLIQDQDGVWWITEFTGSKPRNAKVTTKKLEDYIYHSFYENKENWGKYFTRIRLSGDYTASLDLARSYADNQNYPKYNLFTNNCLHYVKTIMKASSCS
jgi:RHS repeat-associated protein